MASQEPPSVASNFYLKTLNSDTNSIAYEDNFINIKSVEPSLGVPSVNTYADPTSAYYFPLIANADNYKDSRKMSNYSDTLVYFNDNIGIGTNNPNNRLTVFGTISGNDKIIIGNNNNSSADYSSILGGQNNTIELSGTNSGILAGYNNIVSSSESFIIGGHSNQVNGEYSFIDGGFYNEIEDSSSSFIVGGSTNYLEGVNSSSIIGGALNSIIGQEFPTTIGSSIINGVNSNITGSGYSNIIGSNNSYITENEFGFNSIIGGTNNSISNATNSHIIGSNINVDGIDNTTFIENLSTKGSATINGDLTVTNDLLVFGSISAISGITVTSTNVNETSSILIYNTGFGPALDVTQVFGSYPVAVFKGNQISEILYIGNTPINPIDGTTGFVGINTNNPNVELTVNGSISSNNIIYTNGGNSNQWNIAYDYVNQNGSDLLTLKDTVTASINNWNSVYTNVSSNSANWNSVYTNVSSNSANWNSVYTDVSPNSANWNSVYTDVSPNSANWNSTYNSVCSLSTGWSLYSNAFSVISADIVYSTGFYSNPTWLVSLSAGKIFGERSNNWDSVYTTVNSFSGDLANNAFARLSAMPYSYNIAESSINPVFASNNASGNYSNITGGSNNIASGPYSSIVNGSNNIASYDNANIVNGNFNIANNNYSTVLNGSELSATGYSSTVLNGENNIASGNFSFIAGGYNNNTDNFDNTFILGTDLIASQSDTTYVNNLSSQGIINARGGSSNDWNDSYTNLISNSALYLESVDLSFLSVSGNWQNTFNTVSSLSANWNSAYNSTTALNLSSGDWNSTFTTLCANSATWEKFQPNPQYLADNLSDAIHNSNRYYRINENYFGINGGNEIWIQKYNGETVWKIGYTECINDCYDTVTYTSLTDSTYPWDATWVDTSVTKAPVIQLIGQPLAVTGTEGTSQWSARADHKHPFPTAAQVGAAPTVHTHNISDVTDLQSNLNSKAPLNPALNIDNQVEDISVFISGGYALVNLSKITNIDNLTEYNYNKYLNLLGDHAYDRAVFIGEITAGGFKNVGIGWDGTKWIMRVEGNDPFYVTSLSANGDAQQWPWYSTFTNSIDSIIEVYNAPNLFFRGPSISPTLTIGENYDSGTSTNAARADHQHPLPYQSPNDSDQNIFILNSTEILPSPYNGIDTLSSILIPLIKDGYWATKINRKNQYGFDFQYQVGFGDDAYYANVNYNLSWTINESLSAWVLNKVNVDRDYGTTTTVLASSLSDTTYPWDAIWTPTNTFITRQYNITPLQATSTGSAGISPYISRADHTHPLLTPVSILADTTYTIALSDAGRTIGSTNADTGLTAKLVGSYPDGFQTTIIQLSTARVTFTGEGITINHPDGFFKTSKRYSSATLIYTGVVGGWILYGDLNS
jgi:hypothetical protein